VELPDGGLVHFLEAGAVEAHTAAMVAQLSATRKSSPATKSASSRHPNLT